MDKLIPALLVVIISTSVVIASFLFGDMLFSFILGTNDKKIWGICGRLTYWGLSTLISLWTFDLIVKMIDDD